MEINASHTQAHVASAKLHRESVGLHPMSYVVFFYNMKSRI